MKIKLFLRLIAGMVISLPSFCITMASPDLGLPSGYPETSRQRVLLNTGWKFRLGEVPAEAVTEGFDDTGWERVSVPHTLKLASLDLDGSLDDKTQATFQRDIGWYRREFAVAAKPTDKIFLEFEAVRQVTDVWVNGKHVGQHSVGGYTPFHFDISEHVHRDGQTNVVVVRADNRLDDTVPPDGGERDYILFSGMYRDVYLVVTDPVHVPFAWQYNDAGVRVTTPTVSNENATVSIRTNVRNDSDSPSECAVLTRVVDADNKVVLRLESEASIASGQNHTFDQIGVIKEDLRLWSCEDPYLYRVNTLVSRDGVPVDCVENPLGIRKFELREGTGFVLNGEPIELIGTNRHQQFPYVGDAVPNSLHIRDAEQFKDAGFNVVRLAHYPHDDSFLEACDRLGILVCEEAPTWIEFGNEAFQRNLELALRRTIRNHRNHPSVIAWGGGINHLGPLEYLHNASKQEDPSRLTVSNGTVWTGVQGSGVCDLWGVMDYRDVPETDEFLFSIEHKSSDDARSNQILISRYKASWRRIGLAAWNAHDYNSFHSIDEADPLLSGKGKTPHVRKFGIWDYFRQPRPVFYWYQSELTSEPMVHIADERAAEPGVVKVFSNCDSVELFHDGVSLGRQEPDQDPELAALDHPPFSFPVDWKQRTLRAQGFVGGEAVAEHSRSMPKQPNHLVLRLDMEDRLLTADGADLLMAYAEIRDDQGTIVTDCEKEISFRVEGPAKIVGDQSIAANPMQPIRGVAPVLIQAGEAPGLITLYAAGKGLPEVSTELASIAREDDCILARAQPIHELDELRVDLGLQGQLLQETWSAWNGKDKLREQIVMETDLGETVSAIMQPSSGSLTWKRNRGMPRPLCYLAEDAVASEPGSSLELTLTDLPVGHYQLTTYHHVLSPQGNQPALMTIAVTDASGEKRVVSDEFQPTVWRRIFVGDERKQLDIQTRNLGPSEVTMSVHSDGEKPVSIQFRSNDEESQTWLNGFRLKQTLE